MGKNELPNIANCPITYIFLIDVLPKNGLGWVYFSGHCYMFTSWHLDFLQAEEECNQVNRHTNTRPDTRPDTILNSDSQ